MVTNDANTTTYRCGSTLPYGVDEVMEFHCKPPIRARYVKITSIGINTTLVVCEVDVFTIGKCSDGSLDINIDSDSNTR